MNERITRQLIYQQIYILNV